MSNYTDKKYEVFNLFDKQWALVTAGNVDDFNACTISWGSMGTIWTGKNRKGSAITVYIHPARHTLKFMQENEYFTVSFFDKSHRKALAIMGTKSGRDGNKVAEAGLTPVSMAEGGMTFAEANFTFLCRKVYQHPFAKEGLAEDVQTYYATHPHEFPQDEDGNWQPHWMFIGEIVATKEV